MSLYDDFEPRKPKARRSARKPSRPTSQKPSPATRKTPATEDQAPRLKITVQRPDQLDAMARRLGLSKAAVFNLALAELAERHGVR